ncbi:MAG: hypothetical protein J07HX64_00103 [halophilic archaeon J07HX64]|nr:MAG: hypothetical protein J07HX64_00103 [halophilic archaeon J07HX64]
MLLDHSSSRRDCLRTVDGERRRSSGGRASPDSARILSLLGVIRTGTSDPVERGERDVRVTAGHRQSGSQTETTAFKRWPA